MLLGIRGTEPQDETEGYPQWVSTPSTNGVSFQYGSGFHLTKRSHFGTENIKYGADADVGSPLGWGDQRLHLCPI